MAWWSDALKGLGNAVGNIGAFGVTINDLVGSPANKALYEQQQKDMEALLKQNGIDRNNWEAKISAMDQSQAQALMGRAGPSMKKLAKQYKDFKSDVKDKRKQLDEADMQNQTALENLEKAKNAGMGDSIANWAGENADKRAAGTDYSSILKDSPIGGTT